MPGPRFAPGSRHGPAPPSAPDGPATAARRWLDRDSAGPVCYVGSVPSQVDPTAPTPRAAHTRVVDAVWINRRPLAFRALCERAVPSDTRLLVLDLDRTVHLGRNMGELLGWEISAYRGYPGRYLSELEPRHRGGRLFIDRAHPIETARYLWNASQVWAPPGLFYLRWGRLARHIERLRRHAFDRFGPEPVRAVQRLPQYVLMQQIAALPDATTRTLMERVWARNEPEQVIERADLDWLRARSPGLRVVISSASPVPVVEVAAERLGADLAIGSTFGRVNSGRAKLDELRRLCPELGRGHSVGISDTGYGEDHAWTEAFDHLIDLNSTDPFPPIVAATSPLVSITSSPALTRAERDGRVRRAAPGPDGDWTLSGAALATHLAAAHARVERLVALLRAREARLANSLAPLRAEHAALDRTLAALSAPAPPLPRATRHELRSAFLARLAVDARAALVARPLAGVAFALARALEDAREALA